jgi:hypothetical protein
MLATPCVLVHFSSFRRSSDMAHVCLPRLVCCAHCRVAAASDRALTGLVGFITGAAHVPGYCGEGTYSAVPTPTASPLPCNLLEALVTFCAAMPPTGAGGGASAAGVPSLSQSQRQSQSAPAKLRLGGNPAVADVRGMCGVACLVRLVQASGLHAQ